jgi:hypothetical protein
MLSIAQQISVEQQAKAIVGIATDTNRIAPTRTRRRLESRFAIKLNLGDIGETYPAAG